MNSPQLLNLDKMKCPVCGHTHVLTHRKKKVGYKTIRQAHCMVCESTITLDPVVRHCRNCGKKFETFREFKVYCKPSCNLADWRKRNAQA